MNDENSYSVANISGDILAPNLNGVASFKPYKDGTMVDSFYFIVFKPCGIKPHVSISIIRK